MTDSAKNELPDATSVTIGSNSLFHSPGWVPWVRKVYEDGDRVKAVELLATALPTLPLGLAWKFLNGKTTETVEGDTITIELEEVS